MQTEHFDQTRNDLLVVMQQGRDFVESLDTALYTREIPRLQLSAIGDHYRHHLDYVRAFIHGIKQGRIDYDARERSEAVATRPRVAIDETDTFIERLDGLAPGDVTTPVTVVQAHRVDETSRPEVTTSASREFAFLITHAVHHYAIIAIVARNFGVEPSEQFGMMPSTLRHLQNLDAAE